MKYRIKIRTYGSGRKTYEPQVKKWFWQSIDSKGEAYIGFNYEYDDMSWAMDNIENHRQGNTKIINVEIKYV
jgi:hypothetical protein